MATADTLYSARFPLPELLERGRDNLIRCFVYRDGALVAPSSGTVSVYNASNVAVVDAAAVTIVSQVAQRSVSGASLSSQALGDGWRIEWSLLMPDATTRLFRQDGALVRSSFVPPITDVDLFRRVSGLDPSNSARVSTLDDYQDYIDEAHVEINNRLISAGRRPWLVVSPSSLRQAYLYLTLALIFEDFATRLDDAYSNEAKRWRSHHKVEWDALSFRYDETDAGAVDTSRRKATTATFWLGSGGSRSWP